MVYNLIAKKKKTFALLIDPDKYEPKALNRAIDEAQSSTVDIILLGGSLVRKSMEETLAKIKNYCSIPVVLFPGSAYQFCKDADAIFLLSLISGRNPDYLIGNHIIASQAIKESGMEVIPTGYILIESGVTTAVQYMSNTMPIPRGQDDIAIATALAGQQLGLKLIYLEAGSGAENYVPPTLIQRVCENIDIPVVVGGGLRTPNQIKDVLDAGASMVVVGNCFEKEPWLLKQLVAASR